MKEFNIHISGVWHFNRVIQAGSEEEAREQIFLEAIHNSGLIDIIPNNGWLDGEYAEGEELEKAFSEFRVSISGSLN
jgi:hypothetical protein